MRSVLVEPEILKTGVYVAKYTNTRSDTTFIDRSSAEHYIRKEIAEPDYVGQLHIEKYRNIYTYAICPKCGHIGCMKKEAVFQGPSNVVNRPITTTLERTCPECTQGVISIEISTEQSSNLIPDADCDWLEHWLSNDVKKAK